MRPIKKDFNNITTKLKSSKVKAAFDANTTAYIDKNRQYGGVREDLKSLYKDKCGYCEKYIGDEREPIEHYRPKKGKTPYYWLAYSWGNLLLSCDKCNSHKSTKFPIENEVNRIKTKPNLDFDKVHSLTSQYNNIEKPLLLSPEYETQDSLDKILDFELDTAKIVAKNKDKRMQTTIDVYNLNRDTLRRFKRLPIVNNIKEHISRWKVLFKNDLGTYIKLLSSLKETLKTESENESKAFLAYRQHILKNFNELLK